MAMVSPSALPHPNTLHITVRFTASIPDLSLDIPHPSKTTVIYLKHLIRSNLPPPTSSRRLRLIYSGKILPDTALLPSVLKIPPPPPRPPPDPKGKGKAKATDIEPAPTLIFINCSIGDPLSADQLAAEASAATARTPVSNGDPSTTTPTSGAHDALQPHHASTTPASRGFDRLLGAGFSPAEVGQLRVQFLAIQAAIHTPDSMPSPTTLRRMEDSWIDDNGGGGGSAPNATAEIQSGALDDLLWGLVMGFLWPLGCMAWLSREDGVWSARQQTAVWSGFILCLSFGVMNLLA